MIKSGVKLKDLSPQMVLAHMHTCEVFKLFAGPSYVCTITSANDGKHSANSWHYSGRALDYRTKDLPPGTNLQSLRDAVKSELGEQFDVVMEDIGGVNEHLHIEWEDR